MAHPNSRRLPVPLAGILLAGTLSTLLTGCGGDDNDSPTERQATVQFAGQINGQDLSAARRTAGSASVSPALIRLMTGVSTSTMSRWSRPMAVAN